MSSSLLTSSFTGRFRFVVALLGLDVGSGVVVLDGTADAWRVDLLTAGFDSTERAISRIQWVCRELWRSCGCPRQERWATDNHEHYECVVCALFGPVVLWRARGSVLRNTCFLLMSQSFANSNSSPVSTFNRFLIRHTINFPIMPSSSNPCLISTAHSSLSCQTQKSALLQRLNKLSSACKRMRHWSNLDKKRVHPIRVFMVSFFLKKTILLQHPKIPLPSKFIILLLQSLKMVSSRTIVLHISLSRLVAEFSSLVKWKLGFRTYLELPPHSPNLLVAPW